MTAGTASLPRFCSGMATRKAAPKGPNYSVTAGEHGEPAEGEPHIYVRPQGGRTGIRPAQPATAVGRWRAATRGMPVHDTHAHTRRAFDPLGADDDGGTRLPRVRCAHPRLQSSATPAAGMATGTASLPRFCSGMATRKAASQMLCTDIGMRTAVPPRHAAEWRRGRRRSRDFAAEWRRGRAAPRGPNYSVTAGEHGEPAEGEPHIYICTAPRGSNRHTLCKVSHGRRLVESRHPRDAGTRLTRTHNERSTPLGPMMMGARAFRGFAALTRGYRVVRPLRTDVGMRTAVSQRHAAGMTTGTAAPRMRCTDIGMRTAVPPRHAAEWRRGRRRSRDFAAEWRRGRRPQGGRTTL